MRASPRQAGACAALWAALSLCPRAAAQDEPVFDEKGRPVDKPAPPPAQRKITMPEPLVYVPPVYPEEAQKKRIEGAVVLDLTIDVDGKVIDARVAEPAGHGFDEAALEAAKKLEFKPARYEDGKPFKAVIKYRYTFELEEAPPPPALPATGELRGKVLASGTDDPLANAVLEVVAPDGSTRSVRTDAQGEFAIVDLPPGNYQLTLQAPGHEPLTITERVETGKELVATYRLTKEAEEGVIDIVVRGSKPPREVTRRSIERREIDRIPGTKGDAIRSLENLPGVARPPAIAGVLIVRGSAPFDTQTFVDGIYVPIIYHFGGLSSVVPTELLDKIDFYPGNFSARYGRAMGGIVDVSLRSPRSDGYHGLAQADFVDARLMFEGPIPLADGWTFSVAGRRSYLDAWLGRVLEEAGAGVTQAPVYYDYQLIIEKKWTPERARFRTSFYGSDDALEILLREPAPGEPALSGNIGLSTAFQRLQFGYQQDYSDDDRLDAQLSLGRDAVAFGLSSLFFEIEAFSVIGRLEYSRRLGDIATVHIGTDLQSGSAHVSARLPAPQQPGQPPNQPFSTRQTISVDQRNGFFYPALYLESELTPLKRWRIVPGLRLDYTNVNDELSTAPRLNSRFDIVEGFPRTTLKGGVGVYHQPPQFQQVVEPLGNAEVRGNRAIHYGLGVEQEITRQLEAGVEGFYKQLDDVVLAVPTTSGAFVDYTNDARGYVVGMEVLLKYKADERFFGWLAYTLSRAMRQNGPGAPEVHLPWDQTHILTVLGSYKLGWGWEIGARFRLVSGNLIDPSVCNAADRNCDPTRINALYHGATGAYTPIIFGGDNSERLPMFHQLDVRIDKTWQFEAWKLSAYLDILNAYNSQNTEALIYDYRFSARQYVTGIPILPSLGLRGEF